MGNWLRKHQQRVDRVVMLPGSRFVEFTAAFVRDFSGLGERMQDLTDAATFDEVLRDSCSGSSSGATAVSISHAQDDRCAQRARSRNMPQAAKITLDAPGSSASAIGVTAVTTSTDVTTRFVRKAAASFAARDLNAIGALFADDASLSLVGASHDSHGRDEIEKLLHEFFDAHAHPSLSIGRVWVSKTVSVIEFGFSGVRSAGDVAGKRIPERPFGLVGACAVTFDAAGLMRSHRVYVDLATYIGQTDPERLLAGTKVRAATSPAGSAVLESKGTPTEARNLEVANSMWAALEAHSVENATAPMADDYVYDDYADQRPCREMKRGSSLQVPGGT